MKQFIKIGILSIIVLADKHLITAKIINGAFVFLSGKNKSIETFKF